MYLYHILLITLSNILVQYPFELFGCHTTYGAFTYPAIFILTDLTIRLYSTKKAKQIVIQSMFPALLISYILATSFEVHDWPDIFNNIHMIPFRIAIASFLAYVLGQGLDIWVFQHYRNNHSWWVAPTLSTSIGNLFDTYIFFAIAFYHSSNAFLSEHWLEIAAVDVVFKIMISLVAFVPIYGVILDKIGSRLKRQATLP